LEVSRDTMWDVPILLAAVTGARRSEILGISSPPNATIKRATPERSSSSRQRSRSSLLRRISYGNSLP